jgi:Uma2 family endonuclease
MVLVPVRITLHEFNLFIHQPENIDRLFEYVGGEIYEVVSDWNSSKIGVLIAGFLAVYVYQHDLGTVTGADGGYKVSGEKYIPDAAFVQKARYTDEREEGYYAVAPDLAVEVISPSDSERKLRVKVANYLLAGTTVWVVDPDGESVEVFAPGQPVIVLGKDDVLDGGEVIAGFTLPVRSFLP